MARFGQAFLQQAANPAYAQGLMQVGQQIGSYGRRQREKEEGAKIQRGMLGSVLAATKATATGDLGAINQADQDLAALSEGITDPALLEKINDARITVAQAGVDARPEYINNQARSLNAINDSMSKIDDQLKGITGEDPAFEKLMMQKAKLKIKKDELSQDAQVVTTASDLDFQSRLTGFKREVTLGEQRSLYFQQLLTRATPGSEQYKEISADARAAGAGSAIEADKVRRAEAEAIQLERDELKKNLSDRKWQDGELEAAMERTGMTESVLKGIGPVEYRRARLTSLVAQEKAVGAVNANQIKPSVIDAKSLMFATLQEIREKGEFENLPFGFLSRDIEDQIEGLSDEEYEDLYSMASGEQSIPQIKDTVTKWLTSKFPTQMQEYFEETSITSGVDMQTAAFYQSLRDNEENSDITDAELMSYAKDLMSGRITVE